MDGWMFCERSGFTALRQAAYLPFIGQRRSLVMFAGVFLQVMIETMKGYTFGSKAELVIGHCYLFSHM